MLRLSGQKLVVLGKSLSSDNEQCVNAIVYNECWTVGTRSVEQRPSGRNAPDGLEPFWGFKKK